MAPGKGIVNRQQKLKAAMHQAVSGAAEFARLVTASMSAPAQASLASTIKAGGSVLLEITTLGGGGIAMILVHPDGRRENVGGMKL